MKKNSYEYKATGKKKKEKRRLNIYNSFWMNNASSRTSWLTKMLAKYCFKLLEAFCYLSTKTVMFHLTLISQPSQAMAEK